MSFILNIDTATEEAHVSIAVDGIILRSAFNNSQKDHGAFLQPAVQQLAKDAGIALTDIDAIAVTAGPGSYTGLRVGLASAKGLCYALNKPLITLNTLEVLAASALHQLRNDQFKDDALLCPMIDARRMEVFTAIYNKELLIVAAPSAMVLNEDCFKDRIKDDIFFFGSGSAKWKPICKHPHASFITVSILPEAMSKLSNDYLTRQQFTELAESQPIYLKEFHDVRKS
jgi:tRNA threonylcarbamoyladenosine biosynthesis protein TsaB